VGQLSHPFFTTGQPGNACKKILIQGKNMEDKIIIAGAYKTIEDMLKMVCDKNTQIEALKIELATNVEKMAAMFAEIESLRPLKEQADE
jgi:hypothetical protein